MTIENEAGKKKVTIFEPPGYKQLKFKPTPLLPFYTQQQSCHLLDDNDDDFSFNKSSLPTHDQ